MLAVLQSAFMNSVAVKMFFLTLRHANIFLESNSERQDMTWPKKDIETWVPLPRKSFGSINDGCVC